MSIFEFLGISSAQAAAATSVQHPAGPMAAFSPILMVVVLVAFYFMIIRPQNRKRKEQADLLSQLVVGDEVSTIGGIIGKITQLQDDFVQLSLSSNTTITMQRSSIATILPKGTITL